MDMESAEREVSDAQLSLSMIETLKELVQTIKKVNSIFVGLAIGIPIILALFMVFLTFYIVGHMDKKAEEITSKVLHITQSVNIERPKNREDAIETEMERLRKQPKKEGSL